MKPKVLIVDDLEDNIRILSHTLKDMDLELLTAFNGEIALEIIKNEKPNLILLDILIPIVDGYEVCRRIKQNPETSDIPVIFITALSNIDHVMKGYQLGADSFISKPYNTFEVQKLIEKYIELFFLKKENDRLKKILQENNINF